MIKRKIYPILIVTIGVLLVSCSNGKSDKSVESGTASEQESSSNQESSTDETTSDETTGVESTTEQPTTTVEMFTDVPKVDESIYKPNGKMSQLMKDVLLSKAEFTFVEKNNDTGEKIALWSKLLSEFNYYGDEFWDKPAEIYDYRVIDLDGDGYNEVMITFKGSNILILHYEDNKVYGFMYVDRGMLNIYTSGIFEGSSGAAYTTYSTMSFDKDFYEVTDVVGWENNKFFIEGRDATQEEVIEYMDNDKFDYAIPRYKDVESILNME